MRYIAAYLLLQIGGNTSPSAEDIKKVLGAVGIEAEEERLSKLISELEGKDINEVRPVRVHKSAPSSLTSCVQLIAEGSSKLASVPSGGAAAGGAAPSAAAGGAAAAEEKAEEKKVEEKVSLAALIVVMHSY